MKKFFLFILLVSFFLACKGNIENNVVLNTRISQEELEKLKEPTENVVTLKDEFSGTEYALQNVLNSNSIKYLLSFDKGTNKVSLVEEIIDDDGKSRRERQLVCLRELDNNIIKLDFTPFETYAKTYDINTHIDYFYLLTKKAIERLEKKLNRTPDEEILLQQYKQNLVYYSSLEKYKEGDPNLDGYKYIKLKLENSVKVYKDINPVGTISSDKSTITFHKFFFLDFEDDNCKAPKIFENIVFKKR